MPSEDKIMTPRKFWLRALSGGLLAQFDWLASTMVDNSNANSPCHPECERRK
jgi:hypothetical protein